MLNSVVLQSLWKKSANEQINLSRICDEVEDADNGYLKKKRIIIRDFVSMRGNEIRNVSKVSLIR